MIALVERRTRMRSQRAASPACAPRTLPLRAFARRLQQAIDRSKRRGRPRRRADRTYVLRTGRSTRRVGAVGVEHAPARVRDQDALVGTVDHGLEQRARASRPEVRGCRPRARMPETRRPWPARRAAQGYRAGLGAADEQQPAGGAVSTSAMSSTRPMLPPRSSASDRSARGHCRQAIVALMMESANSPRLRAWCAKVSSRCRRWPALSTRSDADGSAGTLAAI
jgi:hypothetical protein